MKLHGVVLLFEPSESFEKAAATEHAQAVKGE